MLQKCWWILLTILCLAAHLPAQSSPQVKGLWVVRHNLREPAAIDSVLSCAARLGFTDLFIQVRGRGDAYYHSRYEPLAEGVAKGFDPLAYLIERARPYHLRLHAWINVFYLWSSPQAPLDSSHVVRQNPDWMVYPLAQAHADSTAGAPYSAEGVYSSPLIDAVQKHLLEVVADILEHYHLNGLHLDYLRYPDSDADFNPQVRKKFRDRYVLDPLLFNQHPEKFAEQYGPVGYELFYRRWKDFLRDGLSDFVRKLATQVHYRFPRIILSAAVKPDIASANLRFYQEWDRWLKNGWIDWAIPMNYTPRNDLFTRRLAQVLEVCDPGKVLVGVSLYNQTAASAMTKIQEVQNCPVVGYVLFSYDQLKSDLSIQRKYRLTVMEKEARQWKEKSARRGVSN